MTALVQDHADYASGIGGWLAYGGVLLLGGVMWFLCHFFPAELPVWMPWEFSWPVYLAVMLALGWYWLGRARLGPGRRPGPGRAFAYTLGIVLMYAVVQTRYDYLSQHMFFFHRVQHLALHHLGPFLVALAWPGEALAAGMPSFLKPVVRMRWISGLMEVIQHPVVSPVMFVGLIYVWLIPSVHIRVMLDTNLYYAMNWCMALDGLCFWLLVLDPRGKPPAHIGFGLRAILTIVVVPPQIAIGAALALSSHDYYPVYEICGRILPIAPLTDQHFGGLILWIPASMMSVLGLILVLNNMRKNDERNDNAVVSHA